MAIWETEVWVGLDSKTVKHYEDKGYEIPRRIDNQGRLRFERGTKILVKVEDLKETSTSRVTKICDEIECGKHALNQKYGDILKNRKNSDGKDRCFDCGRIKSGKTQKNNVPHNKSLEFWAKENNKDYLIDIFSSKNTKLPSQVARADNDKYWFDCLDCGFSNKKRMEQVTKQGFSCKRCSDGISFPEKFMIAVLTQIEKLNFEAQKTFEWSKNIKHENKTLSGKKKYDFYIPENGGIIIETHGGQHYERGFERIGGRTLEEEQENDRIKENLAIKNGIKKDKYIVIDCSKSDMDHIKNNILNSQLTELYDLNSIDWLKCNEFACKSLVKLASDYWNSGTKSTVEIGKMMNLARKTVTSYLKQAVTIGWCDDYNPKEIMRQNGRVTGANNKKEVVQLSLTGNFIREFNSAREVDKELGINFGSVSNALRNKSKTAGGFRWMFLSDYEQYIEQVT
jgi:hypothetical protein